MVWSLFKLFGIYTTPTPGRFFLGGGVVLLLPLLPLLPLLLLILVALPVAKLSPRL